MPYFSVEFGLDQGYAHIIENDDSFPDHFAKVNTKQICFVYITTFKFVAFIRK